MRVSKLLTELKISFKRLTRYNNFLDTPITSPNQELDDDAYLQIIALYNNKEIQNQLKPYVPMIEVILKISK